MSQKMDTIDERRRRLSLGFCDPVKDTETNAVDTSEDTRGKLLEITNSALNDFLPDGQGRRSSFSTTKDSLSASFEDKKTVCEGDPMTKETLKELGVGIVCKKGLKPESPNQDSFSFTYVAGNFSLYGVYDGHGPSGHHVSNFVKDALPKLFLQHPQRVAEPEVALKQSFITCQEMIELQNREKTLDASMSGCTVSMIYRPAHDQFLVVAHVGDSRAVLSQKKRDATEIDDAVELTIDHKPNLPKEKERIEANGGRVVFDGFYNYRVFAKSGMYPGLNMSRALGDTLAHKAAGLTALPDVVRINVDKTKMSAVLLCTDGVWEFIDSQEAAKLVDSHGDKSMEAAEHLAQESWDRWMTDSNGEISDDITAVVFRI